MSFAVQAFSISIYSVLKFGYYADEMVTGLKKRVSVLWYGQGIISSRSSSS